MAGRRPNAFFKFVKHPGTPAQPFLQPALAIAGEALKLQLQRFFKKNKNLKGLTKEKLETGLDEAVRLAAFVGLASAQKKTPVNSGRLRQSLNIQKRSKFFYTIGTNVKYARWVEEGTKPHIIRVRKARALAFYWDKLPRAKRRRRKK